MLNDPRLDLLTFATRLFPPAGMLEPDELFACLKSGRVRDVASLEAFLRRHLEEPATRLEAWTVARATRLRGTDALAAALDLDAEIDSGFSCPSARETSRRLGHEALRVALSIVDSWLPAAFSGHVEASRTPGHHPVAFGLLGGVLGWTPARTVEAYLHGKARAVVAVAQEHLALDSEEEERALWSVRDRTAQLASEVPEERQEPTRAGDLVCDDCV